MVPTTESVLAVIRASRPDLRSVHDRVAFAIHAGFLASGFSLRAAGSRALADSGGEEEEESGTDGWNDLDNCYAFRYFTDDKDFSKWVDVRCTVINEFLMVDVAPQGSDLVHVPIRVNDFAKESATGNYVQQYKDLDGLVKLFSAQILVKCLKKAPVVSSERRSTVLADVQDAEPYRGPPLLPGGRNPAVGVFPPGYQDLLPGVGAGVFEPRRDAGFESGEAGNLIGPNNAIWGPPPTDPPRPPGPRRDPFGPPGIPGFRPDRFGRGGGDVQHFPGGDM